MDEERGAAADQGRLGSDKPGLVLITTYQYGIYSDIASIN